MRWTTRPSDDYLVTKENYHKYIGKRVLWFNSDNPSGVTIGIFNGYTPTGKARIRDCDTKHRGPLYAVPVGYSWPVAWHRAYEGPMPPLPVVMFEYQPGAGPAACARGVWHNLHWEVSCRCTWREARVEVSIRSANEAANKTEVKPVWTVVVPDTKLTCEEDLQPLTAVGAALLFTSLRAAVRESVNSEGI
jgi:hypothetical protein